MWELDGKESLVQKNWCFWTVVLEKTLESLLDCKEIQPVHPKGDKSWVFIGRADVEAETPILWPPHVKSWLIGKDPDAGKDWGQEEKGTTEDEKVEWHHQHNGHGFRWTLEVSDGQGGLACCDSWDRKESDTTERLNWTELAHLMTLPFCLTTQSILLCGHNNLLDLSPTYGHAGYCQCYVDSARQSITPRVCILCRGESSSGEVPERGIVQPEHKCTCNVDKCCWRLLWKGG